MIQHTAVHYPIKAIYDPAFLRVGLLLWDQVEYLAPSVSYQPSMSRWGWKQASQADEATKRAISEAKELLLVRRIPTSEEQAAAHSRALELLNLQMPAMFDIVNAYETNLHVHLPPGFMSKTCQAFENARIMVEDFVTYHDERGARKVRQFMASRSVAYILMAMLAEECAGDTRRTVTDESLAFASLAKYLSGLHQGETATQRVDVERFAAVAVPTFDVDALDLGKLVALRRHEARGDTFLRQLRRSYAAAVDRHVTSLASVTRSVSDRQELLRVFRQEVNDELKELRRSLRVENTQTLLSKEILVGVLAAAGVLIEPLTSSVITVGSLAKAAVNYREARRKAMRENAMSWLYLAGAR